MLLSLKGAAALRQTDITAHRDEALTGFWEHFVLHKTTYSAHYKLSTNHPSKTKAKPNS